MSAEQGSQLPNPIQRTPITIDERSIDHYGHVNYRQYPHLFEIGQDDYMGRRGIGFDVLDRETDFKSVVKAMSVVYRGELKAGDRPVIVTTIKEVRETSFTFKQHIEHDGRTTTELELVVVMVNETGKVPVPDFLREKLLQPVDDQPEENPE